MHFVLSVRTCGKLSWYLCGYGVHNFNKDLGLLLLMLQAGVSASLPEAAQISRDIDLSPGQPLQSNQSAGNLGVIGRRNGVELGTIGDSFSASSVSSGGVRDQLYNLQMLEAAHFKIPQAKDSERPRTYTPVCILGYLLNNLLHGHT
jgi:hypothetical protein